MSPGKSPCQPRCLHETQLQRAVLEITTIIINYKISMHLYSSAYFLSLNLIYFFFIIAATRSCHDGVLRHGGRAGGAGRDVLQQLLPLPALAAGTGQRHSHCPLGAEPQADPRTSWQPGQIAGSSWKDQNTRVCARSETASTGTCPILSSRGFPCTSDTD